MQKSNNGSMKKIATSTAFASLVLATPSISHAALGDQTLKKGMSDPDVKQLQNVLKEKGYFHYKKSTGYFGPITKEAVRDFQRDKGLKINGVANEETFSALDGDKGKKAKVTSRRLLRTGSRGQAVNDLQSVLKERGFYKGNIDGIFGPLSDDAVEDFQRAHDLSVDGIVGPNTREKLNTSSDDAQNEQGGNASNDKNSSDKKILRTGSRGQAVTDLQQKLDAEGYYTYNVDGIYGSITASAVRKFQRAHHLTVDGIAGPKTFSALHGTNGDAGNQSHDSSNDQGSSMLSLRDSGSAVKGLQKKLQKAGVFHQSPTGYFGVDTDEAVERFQRKHGLSVDGIVGPKTKDKLDHVLSSGNDTSDGGASSSDPMNLIADASHLLGTPYEWGGTTPSGFDCSGFVQYVFEKNDINLPRTVASMWGSSKGEEVSRGNLRPGDIVFYQTYADGPSHNGIYKGNGEFIQSGTSTGVKVSKLSVWDDLYPYIGAKRFN